MTCSVCFILPAVLCLLELARINMTEPVVLLMMRRRKRERQRQKQSAEQCKMERARKEPLVLKWINGGTLHSLTHFLSSWRHLSADRVAERNK